MRRVDGGREQTLVNEVYLGLESGGNAFHDLLHTLDHLLLNNGTESPDGPYHGGGMGYDVHCVQTAGIHRCNRQHGCVRRRNISGNNGLQGVDQLRSNNDGVIRLVRVRTMAAPPLNAYFKGIGGRHHRPWVHTYHPRRQTRPSMHGVNGIAVEALEQAIVEHGLRTPQPFFRRLKNEDDTAVEIAGFSQIAGSAQQYSGMAVVAASVHDSRTTGGVRYTRGLMNG